MKLLFIKKKQPDTSAYIIQSDCITFRPRRVIDVPTEFADDGEMEARWAAPLVPSAAAPAAPAYGADWGADYGALPYAYRW